MQYIIAKHPTCFSLYVENRDKNFFFGNYIFGLGLMNIMKIQNDKILEPYHALQWTKEDMV